MKKLISVIVPVYKVEKYVRECIESLLIQKVDGKSFSDSIEVLFVNDGSPDDSVKIIEEYTGIFKNIRILHQENSGQSVARNNAISQASGDYLFFLDSDDLLPANALAPLYKLAKKTSSEVVISHSKSFNERRSWFIEEHAEVASAAFRRVKFFHHAILVKTPAPWGKLYSRDLILRNNIRFPEGIKLAEDWIFVMNALYKANHISSTPHISYLYRGRDDEDNPSCTQIVNSKVFYDLMKVYDLSLGFNLPKRQKYFAKLFIIKGILYRLSKFSIDNDIGITKPILKDLSKFLQTHVGDAALRVFTPQRRLPLLLIYYEYYSEAHRVLNGEFKKSCLNKGVLKQDNDIIQDFNFLKKKKSKSKISALKKKSLSRLKSFSWSAKYAFSKIIAGVIPNNKNIILVGERLGKTANDSGYHLFKYVNDGEKYNGDGSYYFVTDMNSPTASNVAGYKNVLHYGSVKHFVIFHLASKYVFSDSMRDVFHQWKKVAYKYEDKPRIFLQHGVFALNRAKGYYDKNSMQKRMELPSKFIVSSLHEKKMISDQFGFNDDEIAVTGLSRFDNLPIKRKKIGRKILFMPTWREWLSESNKEKFENSEFYLNIKNFLHSAELMRILNSFNYKIEVCLHHKMHKHFSSLSDIENLSIHSMNDVDVQKMIIDADIMITDYSSACFDFLYQGKPVIYYWFDQNKFFATRGGPLICPNDDMLGPVCKTVAELNENIELYLDNGCVIDKKYRGKINKYFDFKDTHNSRRIVSVIEG